MHKDLFAYQRDGAEWMADHWSPNVLLGDSMGLGKAQPLDAKVLTPDGWRLMGELRVGNYVIGSNGKPTEVTGVFPQGEKDVYEITFSDGARTKCCDDHLWYVKSANEKHKGLKGRVVPLNRIRTRVVDVAGNRQYYIPMVSPVEYSEKYFPIAPYTLGVLLGDGSISQHDVRITSMDFDLIEFVAAELPETLRIKQTDDIEYRVVSAKAGKPNVIHRALAALNLAGKGSDDKHIPPEYLLGSVEQRTLLLQGLLDTDGYASREGLVQFSSNSLKLAEGVADLVMSLGGNARYSFKVSAYEKDHWLVTISLPDSVAPFRISRKKNIYRPRVKYKPTRGFASVTCVGKQPVQCIKVSAIDQLYVTDDYIVTHNTPQSIAGADLVGAKTVLVLCPGIARVNWSREFARWQTKDRSIGIVTGSNDVPNRDVVIASYSILPRRKALEKLLSRKWDLIVADESHNLKNRDASRTKVCFGHRCDGTKGLVSKAKRTWLLSGTPIPNNLSEFWAPARALFPEAVSGLERYRQWLDHFCVYEDTEYGTRILRSQNKADFIERVKPFVLRRKFDDIFTDMPPVRISQVVVQPDVLPPKPEGLAETELIVKAALAKANGGMTEDAKQIMQAAKDFHLSTLRKWTGIAKARTVAEQLSADFEDGMDKIVVFAVHTETIDILARGLPRCAVIDGRTPMHLRDGIIDAFQGRTPGRVIDSLVVHIDIASTALTLTAACQVAFVETTWVPKDIQQAIARCRRIGQTRPVLARIFSLKGSVDEQIGSVLANKSREISRIDDALSTAT